LGDGRGINKKLTKEINMGALIMFGLVIVIANVGGLYFYFQDKKK
jgi:hypothetical protein